MNELYKILLDVEKNFTSADTAEAIILDMVANQSKWISVEDKLPEKNGEYLIYDNGLDKALFSNGLWKSTGKEERGILSDFRKTLNPTHWQPLPEKP